MTFGTRLQALLKEKKIRQEELAGMLGLAGKSTISAWINDRSKPEADTLIKLADILETSTDFILTGKITYKQGGEISISQEEYIDYLKYKNEKQQSEIQNLKNIEVISD